MSAGARELYTLLTQIDKQAKIGSDKHAQFCYLLKPFVTGAQASTVTKKSIRDIYLDVVKGKHGEKRGKAILWLGLDKCEIERDLTDTLMEKHVTENVTIEDETVVAKFNFRKMLADIANEIARDPHKASEFLKFVTKLELDDTVDESVSQLQSLYKIFEETEQRTLIAPDNLGKIKEWLVETEHTSLIGEVVDCFKADKKVSVIGMC